MATVSGLIFPLMVKETWCYRGIVNEEQMQPPAKAFSLHSSWIQFPPCTRVSGIITTQLAGIPCS